MKHKNHKQIVIHSLFLFIVWAIIFTFISTIAKAQTYPPSCVVTAPHSNAYFQQNSDVVIKVYSTDIGKTQQNGTVTLVEFYVDGDKIGESSTHTNNTYTYTWRCAQTGEHRITAKAINNNGVSFTSVGQFVTIGTSAAPTHGMSSDKGKYLANIIGYSGIPTRYNELWNGVSAENGCKWGSVERNRDTWNWGNADVCYNHAADNNQMFRYHAIAWGSQTPLWLEDLQYNVPEFRAELEEYIVAIADRYKYMDQVDVLNEQIGTHAPNTPWFRNGLGGTGTTGYDWAIYLFERVRELLPNTKLVINDYGLVRSSSNIDAQLELVALLRDRGLIDGYGTQSHDFSVDGSTASGLESDLDRMSRGGIPIYVTELDMRGGVDSENNDSQQLSSYQTHFPVYWEHPHVAGITLWGYIVGSTWRTGTGIMQSDGTPKPALTWLQQYIDGQSDTGYPFGTIQGTCCETSPPTVEHTDYIYQVGDVATQLIASGSSLTWYLPDGSSSVSAPTPETTTPGTFTYSVTETGTCESVPTNITVIVYEPQGAFGGTPWPIPGIIEFENFDEGGQDTAYYDSSPGSETGVEYRTDTDVDFEECTDTDGGYNLGYTTAGEWLEYTVNVENSGTYDINLRVATEGAKTLSMTINDNSIATDLIIPDSQGWQEWETVTIEDVELSAGIQVIRVTIGETNYINMNYMEFVLSGTPPTIAITNPTNNSEFTINDEITISASTSATDATVTSVVFEANGILLNTDEDLPYSYSWTNATAGTYTITATVSDSNGLTATDEIEITISEAPLLLSLNTGWNLIGCPISGSTEISSALSSIWQYVEVVKDMEGFWLITSPADLNSLQNLDWGKGFMIKVSQDCELDWIAR